jgi:hypothetical protein
MCFRKLFHKPPDVPLAATRYRALLFAINNYPGSANDLNGCLNDIDDVEKKLISQFPGFDILKFKDSWVTNELFYDTIKDALLVATAGDLIYIHYSAHSTQIPDYSGNELNGYHEALYLYDGPFQDDRLVELQSLTPSGVKVVAKFDTCFSGDLLTKNIKNYIKSRFYQMPGVPIMKKVTRRFAKNDPTQKWIVFSGCGEEQTCADANFDGRANGAFTYFDLKSYRPGETYLGEINKLKNYLPSIGFDQSPELTGGEIYYNDLVLT